MGTYSFSDEAVQDLDNICEYIARQNVRQAEQFFDDVRQKCKLVANFPNMGKNYELLAPDLRGFVVDNYIIFYYPRENGIDVARVIGGYRDLQSLFSNE